MRRPDAREILDLFDATAGAGAPTRIRSLLALVCPDEETELETPGARNARLLALRRMAFGRRMACLSPCPSCSELLEFKIDTQDFVAPATPAEISVEHRGRALRFRLPTMRDVEQAARSPSPLAALVSACSAEPSGIADADDPELHQRLSDAFDAADPLGCILIEAHCPVCGTAAMPVLDPADLLWREFAAAARRLEDDVHILARAYGWAERDILALPEARRRRYVERVTA